MALFVSCAARVENSGIEVLAPSKVKQPSASVLAVSPSDKDSSSKDADKKQMRDSDSYDDESIFDSLAITVDETGMPELPVTPLARFPLSSNMRREYDALARRVLASELVGNDIQRLFPGSTPITILATHLTPLTRRAIPRRYKRRIRFATSEEIRMLVAGSNSRVAFVTLEFSINIDEAQVNFVADYWGGTCTCRSIKRWVKERRGWRLDRTGGSMISCG